MRTVFLRKGIAVFAAAAVLGMVACGEAKGDTEPQSTPGGVQEEVSGEEVPEENVGAEPTVKEEKTSEEEESGEEAVATRTATVELSDSGISISGTGCEAEGSCLKIKTAGVFEISGTLSNGSICVKADKESDVCLILNGIDVHNENGAALFCKKAAKVTIVLAEDSVNVLSDGEMYVFDEGEDEPDSTLFAKQDLEITGEGTLKVTSVYGDAIKGKDSLYINGGKFEIKAVDDGIIGRDLLEINGGVFDVQTESDAIKSSNDVDPSLGNIRINGGVFALCGMSDDIQAENTVTINGGVLTLSAGSDGIQAENGVVVNGGVFQ